MSGGLSDTDAGNWRIIGGIAIEFFRRSSKHYGEELSFDLEPHIAEQIFNHSYLTTEHPPALPAELMPKYKNQSYFGKSSFTKKARK